MPSRAVLAVLVAVGALLPVLPGMPVFWITLLNNIGLGALVAIGLVDSDRRRWAHLVRAGRVLRLRRLHHRRAHHPLRLVAMGHASRGARRSPALGALVLGLLTVRLSGHYLPLGTIAWGLSLYFLFGELELFHRHDGITAIPPFNFVGWDLYDSRGIYYVIWAFVHPGGRRHAQPAQLAHGPRHPRAARRRALPPSRSA